MAGWDCDVLATQALETQAFESVPTAMNILEVYSSWNDLFR